MSKFCTNCGTTLQDDAAFCVDCGTAQAPVQPAAPAPQPTYAAPAPEMPVAPAPAKKSKKGLIIAIVAVAVVVVAAAVAVWFFFFSNFKYNGAIDLYYNVLIGETDKVDDLMPEKMWEKIAEQRNIEVDELKEEYKGDPDVEEEYGDNLKVSFEITDAEVMDKDDLEEIQEACEDYFKVTEAVEIEGEATIKGDDDDDTDDFKMTLIKVDGKYYIYELIEGYIEMLNMAA